MDIQKISQRLSEVLGGLILGGMFFCIEWFIRELYLAIQRWSSNSPFAIWPFHIIHGFFLLTLLFLVSYSCIRPRNPKKKAFRTRFPHIIFLVMIVWGIWYYWM